MSGHWLERPEAGGWFAIWLIRFVGLHFGRGFARLFLYPITLYFYFRRGPERQAARDYFRRIDGKPGNAWRVMHLIHAFAATILDRVFLLARGIDGFRVSVRGVDELHRHLDRGKGVLLLGAHVGSFEVLRALAARRPDCKVKLVMDRSKTPALTQLLEALAPELSDSVIDTARGGTDIVLALSEAAREGAMITLLGDRGRPHELMRDAPFLGADAPAGGAPEAVSGVLALPPFDEYYLSYADRSRVCPPEHLATIGPTLNGLVRPVLIAGGEVFGTWRHSTAVGRHHLPPMPDPFAAAVDAASVEAALGRVARFLRV